MKALATDVCITLDCIKTLTYNCGEEHYDTTAGQQWLTRDYSYPAKATSREWRVSGSTTAKTQTLTSKEEKERCCEVTNITDPTQEAGRQKKQVQRTETDMERKLHPWERYRGIWYLSHITMYTFIGRYKHLDSLAECLLGKMHV